MHPNEVFCRAGCEASEIQENPRKQPHNNNNIILIPILYVGHRQRTLLRASLVIVRVFK
jgi:hypothetical protein